MTITTKTISIETSGNDDIINITDRVMQILAATKIKEGLMTAFVSGSTGSVTTIEYEPALVKDFQEMDQELIPAGKGYHHDSTWGDANGHSHIRASIIGPSLSVPIVAGSMTLGTWQQIVVIDHDSKPRNRKVVVQVMGE